jgi:hypothetical protein
VSCSYPRQSLNLKPLRVGAELFSSTCIFCNCLRGTSGICCHGLNLHIISCHAVWLISYRSLELMDLVVSILATTSSEFLVAVLVLDHEERLYSQQMCLIWHCCVTVLLFYLLLSDRVPSLRIAAVLFLGSLKTCHSKFLKKLETSLFLWLFMASK